MRGNWIAAAIFVGLSTGLVAQEKISTSANSVETKFSDTPSQTHPVQTPQNPVATSNTTTSPGDSYVRMVRLSQAQGKIGFDRGNGKVEGAVPNMPLVQNARLATFDGYAEVEFEDGSSLRVPENSQVNFPQLIRHSSGATATTVQLLKGTMYLSLEKTKGNEFTIKANGTTVNVEPGTHLRLETEGKKTTLAVFSGKAAMQAGSWSTTVSKKQTAVYDPAVSPEKIEVTKKIEEASYDDWDKDSIKYHDRYAKAKAFTGSSYMYGVSDMNYYGAFMNVGGCGSFWRPYFANAAWDPYGNGVWAWYQGAGYSWVSPYPWGWLPYHSGSWAFCPGVGWGWQPGSSWIGLANGTPLIAGRPIPSKPGTPQTSRGGITLRPPGPVRPGTTPKDTLLPANRTPLVFSRVDRPGNFVFEKNSAGLGVPRGTWGGLHGISSHVEHRGFVNREVYMPPAAPQGVPNRETAANRIATPGVVHPGLPNGSHQNAQSWRSESNNPSNSFRNEHAGNAPSGSWHGGASASGGGGFRGGNGGSMDSGSGFHGGGGSVGGAGGFHGGGGGGGGVPSGGSSSNSAGGHK
ncbi:FecR family protein [Edaphobacter albus]|uniref:FecR family protein n=1 Tax=Edaphobacter sp. 4G125 TaxID=2763071 RepID=UPI0016449AE4|nr:FecR family protein [Edaphobacter sp. 4G125]QNI37290.1 FecR domain-containing protein [Edaphobacter sp. 4G125]